MMIKTLREIDALKRGGKILASILETVIQEVRVGQTGIAISNMAESLIRKAGGKPVFIGYGNPPYPAALCVSVNSCVVHGIPSSYVFKPGDIVGLDIGMLYDGMITDMARTVVLAPVTPREQLLVDATRHALDMALAMVKPGLPVGDIGATIQTYIEKQGFGVVRDLSGHGVGHELHEPPEIRNFGKAGTGEVLQAGMVIAIEPMITYGDWKVHVAPDRWGIMTDDGSTSAHFEDTVAVTEQGHEILTR